MDSRGQVALTLGAADRSYVPAIRAAIRAAFGVDARLARSSGRAVAWKLYFNDGLVQRVLRALGLGARARDKRLPDLLYNASVQQQLAFLEGYFLGDSTKGRTRDRLTMTTASRELANGLLYLLGQLGVIASCSKRRPRVARLADGRTIRSSGGHAISVTGRPQLIRLERVWRRAANASLLREWVARPAPRGRPPTAVPISEDLVGLPVRAVEKSFYDGDVYDFSIADDESFVAGFGGGVCCHNSDADVDGGHITTLLLTFFYRMMPKLVDGGHLYLAQPPLYQLRRGTKSAYAMDDRERDKLLRSTFSGDAKVDVSRFKGLGEMEAQELWDTTMDPAQRTLLRVSVPDAQHADSIFSLLMGESAADRREWIEGNARYADNIDA
jgi:hypothetical protein